MRNLPSSEISLIKFLLEELIEINQFKEIRFIRQFLEKRKKFLINNSPYFLLFFSNDWIDFDRNGKRENSIIFYSVKQKDGTIIIIGILFEYIIDGTKKETLIYNKKINCLLYKLLTNKFNGIWVP